MDRRILLAAAVVAAAAAFPAAVAPFVHVGRQPDGSVVVPIGQHLAPAGSRIEFDGRPNTVLALPDGRTLAIANITSLDLVDLATKTRTSYAYPGANGHTGTAESPRGLVASPDGATIYVSTEVSAVQRFDIATHAWLAPFAFRPASHGDPEMGGYPGSLPMGLALSDDGATLFVALDVENAIAAVDVRSGAVKARTQVGVAPSQVVRRGATLAVLDWGGTSPSPGAATRRSGWTREPVEIDPRTGVVRAGAIAIVDATTLELKRTIPTGRHPADAVFLSDGVLAVAAAGEDRIEFYDVTSGASLGTVAASLPGDALAGAQPQALALSADRSVLYVALAGENGVAAYAIGSAGGKPALTLMGALPTDWYPGSLAVLPGGGLAVANLKGLGTLGEISNDPPAADDMPQCGANTGARMPSGGRDAHNFRGSVTVLGPGDLARIGPATTQRTVALATGGRRLPADVPKIRHVFLVIRENRAYDQVLGDMPRGHGDRRFTNFPRRVTPNAHALADDFVLLDNFYSAGTQSGDGHQWLTAATTTDYVERAFPLWARSYPKLGDDPLAFASSGFLWENAVRHGKSVRVYGEFATTRFTPKSATWRQFFDQHLNRRNAASLDAHADVPDLEPLLDHRFPGYNLTVPDQWRADEFERDFRRLERAGALPDLVIMSLGNDHTAGFDQGFPRPCSMIADNDLALGRIVETISHSSAWPTSLVLVTEDDSQDGLDHIDGHRQVALAIGPAIKRHAVVSTMYSQLSFIRTAEAALGLPPMNRFDAAAPVIRDAFASVPDATPFVHRGSNLALDDMNPKPAALSPEARRIADELRRWNIVSQPDAAPSYLMLRAIWASLADTGTRGSP